MDAVLVDSDNSGQVWSINLLDTIFWLTLCLQNEIVTCSGGQNTGSLRIIRNGANFAVDAVIDGLPNVTTVWPLKSHSDDE